LLTPRQELVLRLVVDAHAASGSPVGSKALAADPALEASSSTIRNELATLEDQGLLAHPHTSAGRVPTDAGHRYYVDHLLDRPGLVRAPDLGLGLIRREVDEAMRATTETLSQVTNLLAIVSAPPIDTATIRHIEVLALQPQVLMVVIITSTGGVSKRVFTFEAPVDAGLVSWAADELNGRLVGLGLGARTLRNRLQDPTLGPTERGMLEGLAPAFTELAATAEDSLYVEGAGRLLAEHRLGELSQINDLLTMLERRVSMLGVLQAALNTGGRGDVLVRIGSENEAPALQGLSFVGAGYGLAARKLGTVSVIGPRSMRYGGVIASVREAAVQLSRFVEDVYEDD
jgi:heat-inducible transcriptional repressor